MKKSKKPLVKLNIGCGIIPAGDGFINVDNYFTLEDLKGKQGIYQNAVVPKDCKFVKGDMCNLPFKDNYADYIETIDVIEHIGFRQSLKAFSEMYRVLKPGGKLCIMTEDFNWLAQKWVDTIKDKPLDVKQYLNLMEMIFGNQRGAQGDNGEYHRQCFTPDVLANWLTSAGFKPKNVKVRVYKYMSTERPPILTQTPVPGGTWRSDILWAEAIK